MDNFRIVTKDGQLKLFYYNNIMQNSDKIENIERIHCNSCGHKTKHRLVAKRKKTESDVWDEETIWYYTDTFTLLECCGCDNVTLRRQGYFSEGSKEENKADIEFYPPPMFRPIPHWHLLLPLSLSSLLREVYVAIQADSRQLAIMGSRTLIELFMNDKIGDIGGFERKSEVLLQKGFLSKVHKEFLDAALEAGHAVTHRGYRPKKETVSQVIDIVENLLQTYVLNNAALNIKQDTPKRKKKKTEKPSPTKE